MRNLIVCVAALALAACGGGSNNSSSGSTSGTTGNATTTGATTTGGPSTTGTNGSGSSTGGSGGTTGSVVQPPTIASFSATPNALPATGGDVTLTWSVTGAQTLALYPNVGDVTGLTTFTAHVTSPTTFRLVATNAGGSTAQATDVTIAAPQAVNGTVTDLYGLPAYGLRVFIVGTTTPTLTDSAGKFTVAGVNPPYTLVLTDIAGEGPMEIFDGITSLSPSLVYFTGNAPTGPTPPLPASITGNITGGNISATNTILDFGAATASGTLSYNGDPTSYSVQVSFASDAGVSGSVAGLQYETISDDGGVAYLAYGRVDGVQVAPGDAVTADLTLASTTTNYLSIQSGLSLPGDAGFSANGSMLFAADHLGFGLARVSANDPTTALSLPVPNVTGASYEVLTEADVGVGGCYSEAELAPTSQTTVNADMVSVPLVASPVNNATNVTQQTIFAWAGDTHADTGYLLFLSSESGPIYISTKSTQFQFPDLTPIGFHLGNDTSYEMQVAALRPTASPEAVLPFLAHVDSEGGQVQPPVWLALCGEASFITAP